MNLIHPTVTAIATIVIQIVYNKTLSDSRHVHEECKKVKKNLS